MVTEQKVEKTDTPRDARQAGRLGARASAQQVERRIENKDQPPARVQAEIAAENRAELVEQEGKKSGKKDAADEPITYTEPQRRRVRQLMVREDFRSEGGKPDLKKIAYAVGNTVEAVQFMVDLGEPTINAVPQTDQRKHSDPHNRGKKSDSDPLS